MQKRNQSEHYLPAFLLGNGGALGLRLVPALLLGHVVAVLDGEVVALLDGGGLALPHGLVPALLDRTACLGRSVTRSATRGVTRSMAGGSRAGGAALLSLGRTLRKARGSTNSHALLGTDCGTNYRAFLGTDCGSTNSCTSSFDWGSDKTKTQGSRNSLLDSRQSFLQSMLQEKFFLQEDSSLAPGVEVSVAHSDPGVIKPGLGVVILGQRTQVLVGELVGKLGVVAVRQILKSGPELDIKLLVLDQLLLLLAD